MCKDILCTKVPSSCHNFSRRKHLSTFCLDISHVGVVCRVGDKLTFIHASTTQKKVIVNEAPLQEYVESIKRNSGIMIVRPQMSY